MAISREHRLAMTAEVLFGLPLQGVARRAQPQSENLLAPQGQQIAR